MMAKDRLARLQRMLGSAADEDDDEKDQAPEVLGALLVRALQKPSEDDRDEELAQQIAALGESLGDRLDDLIAAVSKPSESIALLTQIASRPDPKFPKNDMGPLIDAVSAGAREQAAMSNAVCDAVRSMAQEVSGLRSAMADLSRSMSVMVGMAKDLAEMKASMAAPRRILTDINGDPIGIKIGD
jgi:hypothetical protein